MTRLTVPCAGLILLVGCAATTPMTLGPDHPANPDAPASTEAAPSTVLALPSMPATAPASRPSAATYTCPHHPEVVSNEPGQCPKCNMKLVRKEGGDGHAH